MGKVNYGIDAPKVIRNLIVIGILLLIIGILLSLNLFPSIASLKYSFFSPAVCLFIAALFMLLYSKFGKLKHRDRILNMHK